MFLARLSTDVTRRGADATRRVPACAPLGAIVCSLDGVEEPREQIDLPATGEEQVDAVIAQLTGLVGTGPAEHVAVYDAVHRGLSECLAGLDSDRA
jgi:hypothetical protein